MVVTITGCSSDGAGVTRLSDGRVCFVEGAARDEVCEIVITGQSKRFVRGRITRIITPSPHRIEPDCPVYGDCGGCRFRHITYEEELRVKLLRVNDALERIGGVSVRAEEILTTGQTQGYRNRATLHGEDGERGFYRAKTHELVPVERCLLLSDEVTPTAYELDGLTFRVSPGAFFQVNTGAALLLFQKAREYAVLRPDETLLDLYCGVGALTLFLGRDAGRAFGVENAPSAVEDARQNAERNGINADFICADAGAGVVDPFPFGDGDFRPDCVVADPPRRGMEPAVIERIIDLAPSRVVYVSCDPATLARDIKLFTGYETKRVCAVDMFPRTKHTECVVLLERPIKNAPVFNGGE